MSNKNILLMCGGGGTEHDISIISSKYFEEKLSSIPNLNVYWIEIGKDQIRRDKNGDACELRKSGELILKDKTINLDYVVPCIHGPPGETGGVQAVFELMGLPYLGSGPEASIHCFNKVTTKLWLSALDIPNSPYIFLSENDASSKKKAQEFFKLNPDIFVKATNQGCSVGCYHVTEIEKLSNTINEAFNYSNYVLLEKTIKARELEIAVFEYNGEVIASPPGEIICPDGFYSFDEKYADNSKTETITVAKNIDESLVQKMKEISIKAFKGLKLKDLARIDFFLTTSNEIYINEINTFPGHTQISMFPSMLENTGVKYSEYLNDRILQALKEKK